MKCEVHCWIKLYALTSFLLKLLIYSNIHNHIVLNMLTLNKYTTVKKVSRWKVFGQILWRFLRECLKDLCWDRYTYKLSWMLKAAICACFFNLLQISSMLWSWSQMLVSNQFWSTDIPRYYYQQNTFWFTLFSFSALKWHFISLILQFLENILLRFDVHNKYKFNTIKCTFSIRVCSVKAFIIHRNLIYTSEKS